MATNARAATGLHRLAGWKHFLERWHSAGLLDPATVERIRAWELEQGQAGRTDRLAQIAFGLGGLLLAAGVLLFVAAHWDELSPVWRFAWVLSMVALFHAAGAAVATRMPGLSTTLHAVGTAALGAGIFLAGQIFNLAEHWPGALLLWALGAAGALVFLRDWPHVLWVAVLVPAWLFAEWIEPFAFGTRRAIAPALTGCLLLALVYLSARSWEHEEEAWRAALARLGAIALVPIAIWLGFSVGEPGYSGARAALDSEALGAAQDPRRWIVLAWAVALLLPAAVAFFLRGRDALFLIPAAVWALLLVYLPYDSAAGRLLLYALYAMLSVGLVVWGVRDHQALTINMGVLGFALTIAFFYFASLFDKFGRSLGLIGIGALFIAGGWALERLRRRLVDRIGRSTP